MRARLVVCGQERCCEKIKPFFKKYDMLLTPTLGQLPAFPDRKNFWPGGQEGSLRSIALRRGTEMILAGS
jgi:hypothetical protein